MVSRCKIAISINFLYPYYMRLHKKVNPARKILIFCIFHLIFDPERATISVVSSCKSDDADKLSSCFSMMQRGLPRKGAASSLSCAGALPPQSAEENLCRVRPLQHSEWRAEKHAIRVEPWNVSDFFRRFIP